MDIIGFILWPIKWVHEEPWRALLVAAALFLHYVFLRLMARQRTAISADVLNVLAVSLWVVFWPYETQMLKWEKTVIAPIRVDLFLVGILLYAMTVASIIKSWVLLLGKSK